MTSMRVQSTAVAIEGRGVMLTGAPGTGKSELALRLIADGAALIGDDVVEIAINEGRLTGSSVACQTGRLFISGIGLVDVAAAAGPIPLSICVRLDAACLRSDRLANLDAWEASPGHWLPRITLDCGPAAPEKVRLALRLWGH